MIRSSYLYTNIKRLFFFFFFFNDTATTEIYTLSLHDALPIFLPLTSSSGHTRTCCRSRTTDHHHSIPERQKRVIKKSWGYHSGRMSRNYSEQDEHKIKPHILRNLRRHTAVVVHCEGGYR